MRAWAGEVEFAADPAKGYRAAPSRELQALAGRYDNDDAWASTVFVYARDGKLWLNNVDPLTPRADGSWRIGTNDWSPGPARSMTNPPNRCNTGVALTG